jgi:penicillin-binding protein 2
VARIHFGNESPVEGRLAWVAVGIVLVFSVFGLRLFQLQLVQGEDLRGRSERNFIRTQRIEAPRGEIVDRRHRTLATTRPAFDLAAIASELQQADRTFSALAELVGDDAAQLRERFGKPSGRQRFQPTLLHADLDYEKLARVESHRFALPGVVTAVRPHREYVGGVLAAHLLGSIGEIRKDQLESLAFANHRQGDIVGQTGLEAALEDHLHGRAGGRNVVVDVAGREIEVVDEIRARPGGIAVLALDRDLQEVAEAGFASDDPEQPDKMGGLVALDPRNGDVLAMVSRPTYDPNAFAGGIDPALWSTLTRDEWKPLQNRAVAGQYPPGSTYKAFVAAAALQEGVIDRHTRFFCPGSFSFGRRAYRCWRKEGHGSVDVRDALIRSCDVFFYNAGLRLGIDRLAFFARGFGLGQPTGVDVAGEKEGLVPTSAWKQRRMKEPWMAGETVSASIGQGFNLTTPIQLAVAYAAIANGGTLVQPRLVLRLEDANGDLVTDRPVVTRGRVPVDEPHLAVVRDGLVGVVQAGGGTGGRARVAGVTVAGKTGTAQVVKLERTEELDEHKIPLKYRDHAWFACYAPAEAPEIVVAVVAEHGGHGGSAAAPIAQRVLARYFAARNAPVPEVVTAQAPAAAEPGPVAPADAPGEAAGSPPPEESGDAGD